MYQKKLSVCMNLGDTYFYQKIRKCVMMGMKNNMTGFMKLRTLLIFRNLNH
jgi:hypothetical protein